MKFYNKGNQKFILLCIILSLFLIYSVAYYFRIYYINNEILFTKADNFILFLLGISIIIVSLSLILLSIKLKYAIIFLEETKELIYNLENNLLDIEDNNIEINRTTQLMIMNLSKKLGVDVGEKGL